MCNCKNIEIGSYGNQVILDVPIHMYPLYDCEGNIKINQNISIDKCLVNEIKYLWYNDIFTIGCCCGHNKQDGYIQVVDEDVQKMKNLGYKVKYNNIYPNSENCFIPKTK